MVGRGSPPRADINMIAKAHTHSSIHPAHQIVPRLIGCLLISIFSFLLFDALPGASSPSPSHNARLPIAPHNQTIAEPPSTHSLHALTPRTHSTHSLHTRQGPREAMCLVEGWAP
jgi:hypothetical protein